MPCPRCAQASAPPLPRRTALGYRAFRCLHCRRSCNERTGTPFNQVQAPTEIALLVALWRLRDKLRLHLHAGDGARPGDALHACTG